MYIVEPSEAAESVRGKQVLVIEEEDGAVLVEFRSEELVARAFAKDARVSQAAVVENKALAAALGAIQKKQREQGRALALLVPRKQAELTHCNGQTDCP